MSLRTLTLTAVLLAVLFLAAMTGVEDNNKETVDRASRVCEGYGGILTVLTRKDSPFTAERSVRVQCRDHLGVSWTYTVKE